MASVGNESLQTCVHLESGRVCLEALICAPTTMVPIEHVSPEAG